MTTSHWKPSASIAHLRQRAAIQARIRYFFKQRGYLEVETPSMAQHGVTDVYLSNIEARFRNQTFYLQTSPEYHMKRLLAAGSGPIFQFARVFRDDELGRWHNPEFCLLEWYQLAVDHHGLMKEVNDLLQEVLACPPMIKKTYQQIFTECCELDPFTVDISGLQHCLKNFGLAEVLSLEEQDKDQYLFLLMSHVIEPILAKEAAPVAVYDFPPSQAALAEIKQERAARFEVYYRGVELANGFHELKDAALQTRRFEQDNRHRLQRGLEEKVIDKYFLKALNQGLPDCSGVAMGIDRLIALALKVNRISEVMAFGFDRA